MLKDAKKKLEVRKNVEVSGWGSKRLHYYVG